MNQSGELQKLNQYQMYCVIPIIVLAVLPHHPIDAAHARNSAIFHVIVYILGIAGALAIEVKKRMIRRSAAAAGSH